MSSPSRPVQTPALVKRSFPAAEEWRAAAIATSLVARGYVRRTREVRPGEVRVYALGDAVIVEWIPLLSWDLPWDRDMLESLILADRWSTGTTPSILSLNPSTVAWALHALSSLFPDRTAALAAAHELVATRHAEEKLRYA